MSAICALGLLEFGNVGFRGKKRNFLRMEEINKLKYLSKETKEIENAILE